MEPQSVIQDGEVGMIQFEEMLEGPSPLVRGGFNVVDLNGWDVYCLAGG
jgi:hypothetical protein